MLVSETSDIHIQNKLKKSKQAKGDAFACQLFYFLMKGLVVYLLYLYKTPLHNNIILCTSFALVLTINTYLILTIGNNPGFAKKSEEQEGFSLAMSGQICQLCMCKKTLRMKHCYRCQKCVYKYDHHCPWIGACVGEFNQFFFYIFLFTQTIQAVLTMFLVKLGVIQFISARGQYSYEQDDHYSGEYGATTIFMVFSILYSLFVGGLLLFHTYLICVNLTSEQMTKAHKIPYMKDRSAPFNYGLLTNVQLVVCHSRCQPIQWKIKQRNPQGETETFYNNRYYSCC